MYSDEWRKNGYTTGERVDIGNGEPISYRYWYDGDIIVGTGMDFGYGEDAHYEFLWEDFSKLIEIWGGEDNFLDSMRKFFPKKQPYNIFCNFLEENDIKYKRIVFY